MIFSAYSILFLFCGLLLTGVGIYAWRRRSTIGAGSFTLFTLLCAVYIFGAALELASPNLETALFWSKVQYFGTLSFPTGYLIFVIQYTGREAWLKPRTIILLFIVPVFLFVVKCLDDQLRWIYATVEIDRSSGSALMTFTRGPLYMYMAAYSFLIVTSGAMLLIWERQGASKLFRKQTGIMLAGAGLVFLVFGLYMLDIPLIPSMKGLDFNPFAYAIWGVSIAWAMFRWRLFDLAPVARDVLIERLKDGVLVMDAQGRIVDANPEASRIFHWSQIPVGAPVEKGTGGWMDLPTLTAAEETVKIEKQLKTAETSSYFELTISTLQNTRGKCIGYLLVIHDISERKNIEKELEELSLQDELTNLTNRRGFKLLATQMLSMASRMRLKVALFYMDMDDLKWINDSLGHAAGDQALQGMAAVLKGSFRSSDILARYGGDEFVALVVITADHSTENLLTRIQEQVGLYTQSYSESRLSFSTGIATFTWDQPLSLDGLLAEADRAMYKIKLAKKVS